MYRASISSVNASPTKKRVSHNHQLKRYRLDITLSGGRSSVSGIVATVFGSTGFLGRYVVGQLARVGSQVMIPFRGEEKSYTHMKVMGDLGMVVPVRWDLRDKDSIRNAAQHSNVIINLVAAPSDTRNYSLHEVNVEGAKRIAEVAKELKVDRFIHVSAVGASNSSDSDWLRSKAEGEAAVKSVNPDATIMRVTDLFGNNDKFLVENAITMRLWPIFPLVHPKKQVQPIWANDVATAILHSLRVTESVGKTYELGGPHIYTMRQVADFINMVLKMERRIVEVNENVAWHLGYWMGQLRKPRFTLDYVQRKEDNICSGTYPGISDIGIKPLALTSAPAMGWIIPFRRASRQMDITLDQLELPEGVKLGKAAY